jgi:hypothetical protein
MTLVEFPLSHWERGWGEGVWKYIDLVVNLKIISLC